MQVKAQGLLNATKWTREQFGHAALERILQMGSPRLRARCDSAIAINWHPIEELVEFLEIAERVVGRGDGTTAERIGEAGARANMKGAVIGLDFWVANPEFLTRRVEGLWRQFNDTGNLVLLHVGHDCARVEVTGITTPSWLFCCTLTGWGKVTAELSGVPNPIARHSECCARGAARCVWEVTVPNAQSTVRREAKRTSPVPIESSQSLDNRGVVDINAAGPYMEAIRRPLQTGRPRAR